MLYLSYIMQDGYISGKTNLAMYSVGITGNIACGKSQALNFFKALGAKTISADIIARTLTVAGQPAWHKIVQHFSTHILKDDNELNRTLLREIISQNSLERIWLESLLHPLIRLEIQHFIQNNTSDLTVVEIPLLLNRADYPYLNRILVLLVPSDIQLQRLLMRDGCTIKQAQAMMALQPSEHVRRQVADDIIINSADKNKLKHDITHLYEKYTFLAQNHF